MEYCNYNAFPDGRIIITIDCMYSYRYYRMIESVQRYHSRSAFAVSCYIYSYRTFKEIVVFHFKMMWNLWNFYFLGEFACFKLKCEPCWMFQCAQTMMRAFFCVLESQLNPLEILHVNQIMWKNGINTSPTHSPVVSFSWIFRSNIYCAYCVEYHW